MVLANGLDIIGDLVLGEVDRLPPGICVGGNLLTEGEVEGVEIAVRGAHKIARLSIAATAGPNNAPSSG